MAGDAKKRIGHSFRLDIHCREHRFYSGNCCSRRVPNPHSIPNPIFASGLFRSVPCRKRNVPCVESALSPLSEKVGIPCDRSQLFEVFFPHAETAGFSGQDKAVSVLPIRSGIRARRTRLNLSGEAFCQNIGADRYSTGSEPSSGSLFAGSAGFPSETGIPSSRISRISLPR